jgi:hypothetical protein
MRRVVLIAVLALLLAVMGGANKRPGTYNQGEGDWWASGTGSTGGIAAADTIIYLVQHESLPNTAASAEGWLPASPDSLLEGDDGSTVMWGMTKTGDDGIFLYSGADYQIITTALSTETDISSDYNYKALLWFSLDGVEQGDRIEDAYLCFNMGRWSATAPLAASNEYIAARGDTVSTDALAITSNASGLSAPSRMGISDGYIVVENSTPWPLSLRPTDRDDLHDFGPRSDSLWRAADAQEVGNNDTNMTEGEPIRLDVTDIMQQVVDSGNAGSGVFFYPYYIRGSGGGASLQINAGDNGAYVSPAGGNPCLTFKRITRRGVRPWGGVEVPVILTFDDNHAEQKFWVASMDSAGHESTIMNVADFNTTWLDSILGVNPDALYLVNHSKTHTSTGSLSGGALDNELTRTHMLSKLSNLSASDTAGIVDFAWPGGVQRPLFSVEAMRRMVDFGYRASRATLISDGPVGPSSPFAWDDYVNVFMIEAPVASAIFEDGGSPASESYMREKLLAYADDCRNNGKSAMVLYMHDYDDGVTGAALESFLGIVDDYDFLQIMDYDAALTMRLGGATYVEPDTTQGFARLDSLYTADGDAQYLEMIIAPYGETE